MRKPTERKAAIAKGLKVYKGAPCINCGNIKRYTKNCACISCSRDTISTLRTRRNAVKVKIKALSNTAIVPTYGTTGAACFDLYASENVTVLAHEQAMIPTGLAFEIPANYVMLIYPRSGLAAKHRISLANCVGVIDSDYRGEVMVILRNDYAFPRDIMAGERIAQAMLMLYPKVAFEMVDRLSDSARGAGGFGSTGK